MITPRSQQIPSIQQLQSTDRRFVHIFKSFDNIPISIIENKRAIFTTNYYKILVEMEGAQEDIKGFCFEGEGGLLGNSYWWWGYSLGA